jgi:hypothetical protein
MPSREPTDITGVTQNLGRQDRSDTVYLGQARSASGHGDLDLLGIGGQGLIEPAQVSQQIPSQQLAVFISWGHRAHGAQQGSSLRGGQIPFRPARNEVTQQRVQPVDGASPLLSEIIPTIGQQPQTHAGTLGTHQPKPAMVHRDRGHRGRV